MRGRGLGGGGVVTTCALPAPAAPVVVVVGMGAVVVAAVDAEDVVFGARAGAERWVDSDTGGGGGVVVVAASPGELWARRGMVSGKLGEEAAQCK